MIDKSLIRSFLLISAPFTIQRLCELMMEPRKNYSNSEKFMRGVEKVSHSVLGKSYYDCKAHLGRNHGKVIKVRFAIFTCWSRG